jgi:hypothetical protein
MKVRVMFTPFRDGLQSTFGGKVRLEDVLPAMEASAELGIRHFEFGGGALFQAPFFYVGQNPFDNMRRDALRRGPGRRPADSDPVRLRCYAHDAVAGGARPPGRLMAAAGTTGIATSTT